MPLLSSRTSHFLIIDAQARLLPALIAPEALTLRIKGSEHELCKIVR